MKQKVLVIEDDPMILEFAQTVLGRAGYEVERAADGREGLEKAASFQPDLVVLDLMMPQMHGYEVLQRIRETGPVDPKILIASSKSYSADIEAAKAAGANDYLVKPYKAEDLLSRCRSLLSANGAAAGTAVSEKDTKTTRSRTVSRPEPDKSGNTGVSLRFWGTRGSSPAPGPETVRYGGNTACTEIRFGDQLVIVDCGTGIRELGVSLLKEFGESPIRGHIFVGHTHWDHIQGFPFFTPLYIPKNHFNVYSVRGAGKSLERVFRGQMAADYFPVPLGSLSSEIEFIELEDTLQIGPLTVKYHFLNHPGVAIGFRFEYEGRAVTYLSDHETFARLSGDSEVTRRQDDAVVEFARGSDLLICEAQYTEEEYALKRGWGHSTFNDAVDRAVGAGVKKLLIFHHDPTHDDDMMDGFIEYCRKRLKDKGSSIECDGARERETITL